MRVKCTQLLPGGLAVPAPQGEPHTPAQGPGPQHRGATGVSCIPCPSAGSVSHIHTRTQPPPVSVALQTHPPKQASRKRRKLSHETNWSPFCPSNTICCSLLRWCAGFEHMTRMWTPSSPHETRTSSHQVPAAVRLAGCVCVHVLMHSSQLLLTVVTHCMSPVTRGCKAGTR